MKHLLFLEFLGALCAGSTALAVEYTATKTGELTDTTIWSSGIVPDTSVNTYFGVTGNFTLNQDLTIGRLGSNWSSRGAEIVMVDSEGYEITDPTEFHTMTFDGTSLTGNLIELRSNSGTNEATDYISFKNGNYVFKRDSGEISFTTGTNTTTDGVTSAIVKKVEFQNNTNVNVKNALYLGGSSSIPAQSVYIFDGTVNIQSDDKTYQQISIGGSHLEIGGTTSAKMVSIWGNSKLNVKESGTLNLSQNLWVENGGSAVIDGNLNADSLGSKNNAASITIGASGVAKITNAATFNVNSTINGKISATVFYISENTTTVNGLLKQYTPTNIDQNIHINTGATLKVGDTGSIVLEGGYKNITLKGTLDVSAAKGKFITKSSDYGVRISSGGRLILRSTDAFASSETGSQTNYIFWAYAGDTAIDILADNNFKSFALVSNSNLTVTIGEDVNLITLNRFLTKLDSNCIEGIANDALTLTLVGFRENTIKIANVLESDKRADGYLDIIAQGWDNFYVNSDGWLCATAVPEPSTIATIFGALALGLTIYRKRK